MSFCSLTKGITPKICRLCVCVLINKRAFEPFISFGSCFRTLAVILVVVFVFVVVLWFVCCSYVAPTFFFFVFFLWDTVAIELTSLLFTISQLMPSHTCK